MLQQWLVPVIASKTLCVSIALSTGSSSQMHQLPISTSAQRIAADYKNFSHPKLGNFTQTTPPKSRTQDLSHPNRLSYLYKTPAQHYAGIIRENTLTVTALINIYLIGR